MRKMMFALAMGAAFAAVSPADAAHRWNLKEGAPDLQSAGQLAFGPDGVLFVGDAKGAAIFAIDTRDAKSGTPKPRTIEKLNVKLAAVPGLQPPVAVNDLAVHPISGNVYLSVSAGEAKSPGIVKIDGDGAVSLLSLVNVPFLKASLSNVPEDKVTGEGPRARNRRNEAITDIAYVDGKVLVSGYADAAAPSRVRELAFPFADRDSGISVEIYHGAHGRLEDNATIRTFIPMTIDGKPSILAGFTCTPLVRFPITAAEPGSKTRGTTLAELGNRNTPLDMFLYEKDGEKFLLISNTARGVMKVSLKGVGRDEGITEPVRTASGTAGQAYETIGELAGTVQMDKLGDGQAVVVIQKDGELTLRSVPLP